MRLTRLSRFAGVVVLACGLVLAASTAGAGAASARPAPRLAHPTAAAGLLVHRFFTLLEHENRAGLERFLAPDFQIQRADGSGGGKAAYLADLPTVDSFSISKLTATQDGGVLVARYSATATGLVNGKPYTPGPAPRLSVFTWNGTRWQIAAHANFNPLTG